MEFAPFPKMPRLSREVVITEKIDGTNASVVVAPHGGYPTGASGFFEAMSVAKVGDLFVLAGSRNRWITPDDDNYGFAKWVRDNSEELAMLGVGHHFGEWWGKGVNRGYGLLERRFSLFNTDRWNDPAARPACCHVVPTLRKGEFRSEIVDGALDGLRNQGSAAAPGFMDPEGVVVYHTAANSCFKKTIKGDEEGKHAEAHPKKERPPRPPKDPSKGGRRKEQLPFEGEDRRKK